MKVYHSLEEFQITDRQTTVTLGTFDGVHIGHKKVISDLIRVAKETNTDSVLLTFFPHPRMVLQRDFKLSLLNTIQEKTVLLNELGLDHLITHPFSKQFSRLTALEFSREVLVNQLDICNLIVGHDHQFGRNREGGFEQLQEYGRLYDFNVFRMEAIALNEIAISSTKIRKAISEGNMLKANAYLGYDYMLNAKVIHGKKLGTSIGFPTANLEIDKEYKLLPMNGVYVVNVKVDDSWFSGMMNIGKNPTTGDVFKSIEVHLFNFDADIYGQFVEVRVLHRLRDEQKFSSVNLLKEQLERDQEAAILFFKQ